MPRPKMLPDDPEQTQELTARPGPRPWGGKVHDPGKIFMQEMDEKKAARNSDFQAGQTKNVLARMERTEANVERVEQKLDLILEALKQPKAE